ncbi:hypothetical protein CIK05_08030 [Bdellovibrio sp. qaytius]|nr:hypothetical protein CIK05_08030 [Bdellovibrio sp. qaytius]
MPFDQHRMFHQGVVHYLNPQDNTILAHQENYQQTEAFCQHLKEYFLSDLNFKKAQAASLTVASSTEPIEFFEKSDVIDLKYNKNLKNIQLEIKNKGLVSFDHMFVEQTDSCLEFVKSKSPNLVKPWSKSDLIWAAYNFKMSASLANEDFWFLENKNYQSIFDNCLYLQPKGKELTAWCLIPEHQFLNQQFHADFQDRIRRKIEAKFGFVSLSYLDVSEQTLHLMNSQKEAVVENNRVSGFPCFSFYSNENVYDWFNNYLKVFNKKHKIKNSLKEASL